MSNELEDVDKLFMDFQERHDDKHDDKHDDYILLAKRIMENNQ